ncbi:solute carrier family 23 member 2-like [Diadema setosum]|uniref:solute carrier family 23 member 2-like n=1 Tax=Diadema setosum TaxID=31175 RepID=UPI003B3A25A6
MLDTEDVPCLDMENMSSNYPEDEQGKTARRLADSILGKLKSEMTYTLEQRPPWHSTIVLAFQHFLTMISGVLSHPLVLAPYLCVAGDIAILSKILATTFFVCGIQTFLQTTFGVRLPIVQGPGFAFVLPIVSTFQLRPCPVLGEMSTNETEVTQDDLRAEFRDRMQEIQGALLISSAFELIVGFGGITSVLLRYIGPLTIAPTISLIGITLLSVAAQKCSQHWGVAALTMVLIVTFSQYLGRCNVPCASYSRSKGCHVARFPVFRLFPVLLAVMTTWIFCVILTVTDVFSSDPNSSTYPLRTDVSKEAVANTPWFYVPYPGQWGAPSISAGSVFGLLAACLASIVESIGDYYACARLSGAPPPPVHAINRGIGIEGLGGMFSGFWGSGTCPTSYSTNVGVIGLTKVSSRFVIQVVSSILLLCGMFLKLGAVLATIPQPIIGGVISVTIGMVTAVGFSNLQYADMNSARNLFIVGISFSLGLIVPSYVKKNPDSIQTGSSTADQILLVLLETGMFIGGMIGFILDNTIPGTPEERGIQNMLDVNGAMVTDDDTLDGKTNDEVYQLVNECYNPPVGMKYIRRARWTSYLPFSPTYRGSNFNLRIRRCCSRKKYEVAEDV